MTTLNDWLGERVLRREDIDRFLDPSQPTWAKFNRELGYTLGDCLIQDGQDDCFTIGHYDTGGERRCIQYRDRTGRINVYGNSFTQCHQVSDGETWQEYLASHLGEPIRNYGIGGYGVYQAYRRMLRTESSTPAEYIILYPWVDDHRRSLMPCRYLFIHNWYKDRQSSLMFHSTPWAHIAIDPEAGAFSEVENQFPTPQSLYELCDPSKVQEAFADNLIVQLIAWGDGADDVDMASLERLAEWAESPVKFDASDDRSQQAESLYRTVALRGTMFLLDKAREYANENRKKLLIVLGYGSGDVKRAIAGEPRPDAALIDYLHDNNMRYFDILPKHVEDYQAFCIDPDAYLKRYYVGHYGPAGNHFFTFAIKDEIVDWLDPKPMAYRHRGDHAVQFEGYLPDA